jgi:hypothetical protein
VRGSGVALLACCVACGGGGDGAGDDVGLESGPQAPAGLALATANGQVLVAWEPVGGATGYTVYWSLTGSIDVATAESVHVTAPPAVLADLPAAAAVKVVVASTDATGEGAPSKAKSVAVAPGGAEQYFPPWWDVPPLAVILLDHDPEKTAAQNGAALKAAMQDLQPGDRLEVGGGTWSVDTYLNLSLAGTADAPIRIVAQTGETPVLTRADASQNVLNLGAGGMPARFVSLEGLEITGGDIALRLYDCANVWVDSCHVHDCSGNAIAANSDPVDHLTFTRNTVHGTGGTGEGFYIGGNYSDPVAHHCVIARNHVYDTGGTQGDGIELKQGSWGNVIAENYVHDASYPCILVYGTDGNPPNVIERNVCIGSGNNVMQVQGEAIVRNNVLANGLHGLWSGDHQGETRDLVVVHNTILNASTAARLEDWGGRPGMVFANNACYSNGGYAIRFSGGSKGVMVAGNVAFGSVVGTTGGYTLGGGLTDFLAADWDGAPLDVQPAGPGPPSGAGDAAYAVLLDLSGAMRMPPLDAGAVDAP